MSLVGFTVERVTGHDTGKVGRGDPVLALLRKAVIGDTEKPLNGDLDADFLECFADGALFERLEVIQFATDAAPVVGLRRALAERKENAAL